MAARCFAAAAGCGGGEVVKPPRFAGRRRFAAAARFRGECRASGGGDCRAKAALFFSVAGVVCVANTARTPLVRRAVDNLLIFSCAGFLRGGGAMFCGGGGVFHIFGYYFKFLWYSIIGRSCEGGVSGFRRCRVVYRRRGKTNENF